MYSISVVQACHEVLDYYTLHNACIIHPVYGYLRVECSRTRVLNIEYDPKFFVVCIHITRSYLHRKGVL